MEFIQIAIVGVIASLIMQGIKKWVIGSFQRKLATVAVSIVLGGAYALLKDTVYWETILGVLMFSSTIYAFFIKK